MNNKMSERDKLDRVRRMVTKACPDCDQQIPVACKSCTCGHAFTSRKKLQEQLAIQAHPDGIKRRRTERVRRQKPKFYSAPREVPANPVKRQRRRTTSETTGTSTDDQEKKKKRGKPGPKPGMSKVKKEEDDAGGTNGERGERRERQQQQEEEDMFANISAEKALQYSVILAELNRKYTSQNFKPS